MRSFAGGIIFIGMISVISLTVAVAKDKEKNKKKEAHRHHQAHVHGAAHLSMAFEGVKGLIEFSTPSGSIFGFEYSPQTTRDKEILMNNIKFFKDSFAAMIQFDAETGCSVSAAKIGQEMDKKKSDHSDFTASYQIDCKKSPLGTKVKFNFSKYPDLKEIDVTVLVDKLQKNFKLSSQESTVELK